MKHLLLAILVITCSLACTDESNEITLPSDHRALNLRAANKVNVCHNGHMISVSINSLPAHLAHGDVADTDGDGYLSGENDCGLPVDCNDADANLTDNCCPAGAWCGFLTYFTIRVEFNEDCSASVLFNNTPCLPNGAFWTPVSSDGSTFVYIETDPCGITGCTVTVTTLEDGELYVEYSNCPAVAEGTLAPCE